MFTLVTFLYTRKIFTYTGHFRKPQYIRIACLACLGRTIKEITALALFISRKSNSTTQMHHAPHSGDEDRSSVRL